MAVGACALVAVVAFSAVTAVLGSDYFWDRDIGFRSIAAAAILVLFSVSVWWRGGRLRKRQATVAARKRAVRSAALGFVPFAFAMGYIMDGLTGGLIGVAEYGLVVLFLALWFRGRIPQNS